MEVHYEAAHALESGKDSRCVDKSIPYGLSHRSDWLSPCKLHFAPFDGLYFCHPFCNHRGKILPEGLASQHSTYFRVWERGSLRYAQNGALRVELVIVSLGCSHSQETKDKRQRIITPYKCSLAQYRAATI